MGCKTKQPVSDTKEEDLDETVGDMFSILDEETPVVYKRAIYNASETRKTDLIHTHLSVAFDWEMRRLEGTATLTLQPYFYPQNRVLIDAKGMDIHSVELIKNKARRVLEYDYDGMEITISLDRFYKKNEPYTIVIKYTAKPDEYEMGGSNAISGDKGLYFINPDGKDANKPKQIWTQGETEASSRWFPTIDVPNEKMTQEIEITVSEEFKTLSNGLLIYSTDNGDGTRTDHWKQSLPHTPYLAMMAIGDFAVVSDEYVRQDGSKMEVSYYVEKEYEPFARSIFGETPNMIKFFSDLLGIEYVWEKYAQVVVRDYVSGAMENTSATIHGEFLYRTDRELLDEHNESIIAHELFHHWFGDLVTCESWANLPLNESFANYSQYLWDEHRHGRDEADYQAEIEEKNYKLSAENSGHKNMIRYDYVQKEDMFDAHSYNKGGRILHMLRKYVGDEAFFAALNLYLAENKFKAAEIDHLRLAFEEVTGEDLHWFFDQWFFDDGHPVLTFKYEHDSTGMLHLITTQNHDMRTHPVYKLPIAVDIYTASGKERLDIWVDKAADTTTIPFSKNIELVNFDAERSLLAEVTYEKTIEEYIYQFYNAPLYKDRYEALMACRQDKSQKAGKVILDGLDDPFWKIRQSALKHQRRALLHHESALKAKTIQVAMSDPSSLVRSTAIQTVESQFSESGDQVELFENALKDSSYLVIGVGLKSLSNIDLEKACFHAEKLENERSSSLKTTIGDIYAQKGDLKYNSYYVNNWMKVVGFEKISFLKTYDRFLEKQDDKTILAGMEIFSQVARNSGTVWEKYFGGYQTILKYRSIYFEQVENAKTKIAQMEAQNNTGSDYILLQQELKTYETNYNALDALFNDIIKDEKDQQVKDFIDQGMLTH